MVGLRNSIVSAVYADGIFGQYIQDNIVVVVGNTTKGSGEESAKELRHWYS